MKYLWLGTILFGLLVAKFSCADSIWERHNPNTAYLFQDTRARNVGDVLTVAVHESTLFDGKENRDLKKETAKSKTFSLSTAFSAGKHPSYSLSGDFDGSGASKRELSGKADYKSDRTFIDRMSVTVVAVQPNGNLIVEGFRERVVQHEKKMLMIRGIVRPMDIGSDNVVESQYIANFVFTYVGRGPESNHTNPGWLDRFLHTFSPF